MAAEMFFYPPSGSGSGSSGPIEFQLDGLPQEVIKDTGTPANNIPLPVQLLDTAGNTNTVTVSGMVAQALDFGAAANGLRVAALLGNASGIAAFGAGNVSAQTLRVIVAADQSALPVSQSGTWNINNVSGTVSLPTGASTAAKQPALGTAGTASTDVITVQGIASMTPLLVDGSGSTQPISGTVTANQGGTWDINNISGTISLPTGASTAANQATGNASLSSLDTKAVQQALNYGAASGAVRVAAQIGNASAVADFGSGALSAQTLRVVLPTDQPAVATQAPVNAAGNYVQVTNLDTNADSNSAPANAVGFILQAGSGNSVAIRWSVGATASQTAGSELQPAQDTGYIPLAATVSVCGTAGATAETYNLQWVLKS